MSSLIFVCCPNCSDCEKAKKWLDDNKVTYTSRDIVKDKPTTTSEEAICNQLTKDPVLLRCPLAVTDTCVLVGFDETKWKEKLL